MRRSVASIPVRSEARHLQAATSLQYLCRFDGGGSRRDVKDRAVEIANGSCLADQRLCPSVVGGDEGLVILVVGECDDLPVSVDLRHFLDAVDTGIVGLCQIDDEDVWLCPRNSVDEILDGVFRNGHFHVTHLRDRFDQCFTHHFVVLANSDGYHLDVSLVVVHVMSWVSQVRYAWLQ